MTIASVLERPTAADETAGTGEAARNDAPKNDHAPRNEQPPIEIETVKLTVEPSPESHPPTELFQPIAIADWKKGCPTVNRDVACDEIVSLFRRDADAECAVVCDEGMRPIGLVTRHRFFRMLGSTFGMALFGNKPVALIMDEKPLVAESGIQPWRLIDRALKRDEATFYDAVVLTDRGKLAGIVSMNDLLQVSRLLQKEAAGKQVRTVRDTESMVGLIHGSIDKVVESTHDTQTLGDRIAEMTGQGRREMAEMLDLFRLWSDIADRQELAMRELTERAAAADGISKLIAQLADQCNLLAINASIEAARAGQQGKGFGVVAGEIRSLADQTKESASRITRQLHAMSEAVGSAAALIGDGKKGADRGVEQVRRTEDTFARLWRTSEENHEAAVRLIGACRDAKEISTRIRGEFEKLVSQFDGHGDI